MGRRCERIAPVARDAGVSLRIAACCVGGRAWRLCNGRMDGGLDVSDGQRAGNERD
jgi:hypothetical protein